jgi:hypothetical protein
VLSHNSCVRSRECFHTARVYERAARNLVSSSCAAGDDGSHSSGEARGKPCSISSVALMFCRDECMESVGSDILKERVTFGG